METINIHEAKTHFSRIVERVAAGETVVISRAGKPMAKLVPLDAAPAAAPKRLGFMSGQIQVPDDFDTLGAEEIQQLFGT